MGKITSDRIFSDIAHLLVSEGSPERVLEAVADALQQLVPHDMLQLYRADVRLRVLEPVVVRDTYADEIRAMGPLAYGEGIIGAAMESGVPELANDAHLDERAQVIAGTPDEPESLVAIPLLAGGEPKGALCLGRLGEGNRFSGEEFDLAIRFSELAALAIDNAEVRARLETEVITDDLTGLYNHRYFQERLGEEVRRANRSRIPLALVMFDIDDFKRANDCYGHQTGDRILRRLASASREICRQEDVICRIGGEEFAVVLPGSGAEDARALAERLRREIERASFPGIGSLTVSVGVAEAPLHASSSRDLIACADLAMLDAKAAGKNRVCLYGSTDEGGGRSSTTERRGEVRSVGHLKMLQSLCGMLNRMNDVHQIGEAITAELGGLIHYHNCRIHLLSRDGQTLYPIAFRGELSEYQGETFEALVTRIGEGITGRVAQTGEAFYTPDAKSCDFALDIPGTAEVDESILAVPLRHGDRVVGVVALSKLGIDQFDHDDMRLLEVLASHAAVAIENARLLESQREAAESSKALLDLCRAVMTMPDRDSVLREVLASISVVVRCGSPWALVGDPGGGLRLVGSEMGDSVRQGSGERLVLHMSWDHGGSGAIVVPARDEYGAFSMREREIAREIAQIASLALSNATRLEILEGAAGGSGVLMDVLGRQERPDREDAAPRGDQGHALPVGDDTSELVEMALAAAEEGPLPARG